MTFGAAEIGLILSGLVTLVMGLLGWLGKKSSDKIEALESRVNTLERNVAILETQVPGHAVRLTKLEETLNRLEGHMLVVRAWVDERRGHRRDDDTGKLQRKD